MNRYHPSRDDEPEFDGYQPRNLLREMWLAYAPKWVDTVLMWFVVLVIVAGILYQFFIK